MPIVNYVREHTRFIEYATDEKLTSSERLLWYALMHIMNQRAQGKVWPDEFIRIDNDRLLLYCPMKYDTIARARNGLKQRGLIDFTPGDKNKKSPAYRMIYFYPEYLAPDTETDADAQSYPIFADNMGGNMGYNMGGNMGYNTGGNVGYNMGDLYINNKQDPTIQNQNKDPEDDDDTIIMHSRAQIWQAWIKAFGREPNPSIAKEILHQGVVLCHFDMAVICEAIRRAALRGADSPLDYILQLFRDWAIHKIRTETELDDYLEGEGT